MKSIALLVTLASMTAAAPAALAQDCGRRNDGAPGAVIGAISGALLGDVVAKHGHRGDGALLGAVGGALVGSQVGRDDRSCITGYEPRRYATATAYEQYQGSYGQSDRQTESQQFDQFGEQFDHLYEGVEHGLSDGSYTRRQARQFERSINDLRRRLDWYRRNDGYLSPRGRQDIEWRLEQLHNALHEVHQDGHEDQAFGDYNRR